MNITDVDDKTINGSQKKGISLSEYVKPYTKAFFEDLKLLNIEPAFKYPRATEHIKEMVELVKVLLKKGFAYKAPDGIYFSISKFRDYGKLANLKIKKLKTGARVSQDEYEKQQANDFALWKTQTKEDGEDGTVFWETELGKGRPGWHIECSAMSTKYLGKTLDIHTGGIDLIFPHHQNEIAQSEAANNKQFVRYWVHNEWLLVEGKKMSKSLGNFYTLKDIINKGYNPKAIRYLLLSTHYRQQLNFTLEGLKGAENTVRGLIDFVKRLKEIKSEKENKKIASLIKKAEKKVEQEFEEAMDDDLNISAALSAIFNFVSKINSFVKEGMMGKRDAVSVTELMNKFDKVLGILEGGKKETLTPEEKNLIKEREEARKNKDYEKADKIRNILKNKGILLEDTSQGVRWKKIK